MNHETNNPNSVCALCVVILSEMRFIHGYLLIVLILYVYFSISYTVNVVALSGIKYMQFIVV